MIEHTRLPAWSPEIQWCRTAWVSASAKALWAPRIAAFNEALKRLEVESVYHGLRQSALVFTDPAGLVPLAQQALAHHCVLVPLGVHGASGSSYSSQSSPAIAGQPVQIRTVVTTHSTRWRGMHADDNANVGALLGYPQCCREFFTRVWEHEKWRDTTIPMSVGGAEGPSASNILLRWLGVRLVWHLPCSHTCGNSYEIANAVVTLGHQLGFGQEMEWALELLAMPMRWSSLHGVAEITTPLFKISTSTDPLAQRVNVDKNIEGHYPEESATGLHFPFQPPTKRRVTASRSFVTALAHARESRQVVTDDTRVAPMNGFQTIDGMKAAHDKLIACLQSYSSYSPWGHVNPVDVLDLGCGDGALLERILSEWPTVVPHGVENMLERASAAQSRLHWGYIHFGAIADMQWATRRYGLVILMPGRLAELAQEVRDSVVEALTRCADMILVYTYDANEETLVPAQALAGDFEVVSGVLNDGTYCRLLRRTEVLA